MVGLAIATNLPGTESAKYQLLCTVILPATLYVSEFHTSATEQGFLFSEVRVYKLCARTLSWKSNGGLIREV